MEVVIQFNRFEDVFPELVVKGRKNADYGGNHGYENRKKTEYND